MIPRQGPLCLFEHGFCDGAGMDGAIGSGDEEGTALHEFSAPVFQGSRCGSLADEVAWAEDAERGVRQGAQCGFGFSFGSHIEKRRAGIGSQGADEQKLSRVSRQGCPGCHQDVVVIDAAKGGAGAGYLDRRAKAAKNVIDRREALPG